MTGEKTSKLMAYATVAMALSAAVQAVVAFQQFSKNMNKEWADVGALVALGILLLLTVSLAWCSYSLLPKK